MNGKKLFSEVGFPCQNKFGDQSVIGMEEKLFFTQEIMIRIYMAL